MVTTERRSGEAVYNTTLLRRFVIDATVAVAASATPLGFERFRGVELSAPSLMWVEATSALHAMAWR